MRKKIRRTQKKIISIVLAFALLVSLGTPSIVALAEETNDTTSKVETPIQTIEAETEGLVEGVDEGKPEEEKDILQEDPSTIETPKSVPKETDLTTSTKPAPSENVITPMAITTPGVYTSSPDAIMLDASIEGTSTNDHTMASHVWINGTTFYAAIQSTHGLGRMDLNGVSSTDFDEYDPWVEIEIDDVSYAPNSLQGNTNSSHWTVFKFNVADLGLTTSGLYDLYIKGIGGGHDVDSSLRIEVPKVDILGTKTWVDGPMTDVSVVLYKEAGGIKTEVEAFTLSTTSPSFSLPEQPYTDDYGRVYEYTIEEDTEDGYTLTYTTNLDKDVENNKYTLTFSLTNKYSSPMITIGGTKNWLEDGAADRPESITISLYRQYKNAEPPEDIGLELMSQQDVTPVDGEWSYDFGTHPKTDSDGNEYSYFVEEDPITGYSTSYEEMEVDDTDPNYHYLNITNTLLYGGLQINKVDNDENLIIGEGKVATFELRDGTTVISSSSTNPTTGIATFDKIKLGTYTLVETVSPLGYDLDRTIYTVNVTLDGEGKIVVTVTDPSENIISSDPLVITNTLKTGELTVEKIDDGDTTITDNQATFVLKQNNQEIATEQTTLAEGIALFEDLLVGTYTLEEIEAPDGYELDTTIYTVIVRLDNEGEIEVIAKDGETVIRTMPTLQIKNKILGSIDIAKSISNYDGTDSEREFDIILTGPEGEEYVVTPTHNETITISRLKQGEYTLREILPMNYELVSISNETITIDGENPNASATITNKRVNDGFFYDDDTLINRFGTIIRQIINGPQ